MRKTFWEGQWHSITEEGLVAGDTTEPGENDVTIDVGQIEPITLKFDETCPACGYRVEYSDNKRCTRCRMSFGRVDLERVPPPPPALPPPGTREYKVITQRDEFFESKFNPYKLQDALNTFAAEGWRVVSMTATDVGSFLGSFWGKGGGAARQELIILLEKVW